MSTAMVSGARVWTLSQVHFPLRTTRFRIEFTDGRPILAKLTHRYLHSISIGSGAATPPRILESYIRVRDGAAAELCLRIYQEKGEEALLAEVRRIGNAFFARR